MESESRFISFDHSLTAEQPPTILLPSLNLFNCFQFMGPLVSIVIPVYNCREWVAKAIESALAQTWSNKEIIVVDDCSTDGTWDVLKSFSGRITLERAERNGGQNVTRNRLTDLSRGEWLVYLDADDELMPDSIEKKMEFAVNADAIYGTMEEAWFVGTERTQTTFRVARDYTDLLAAAFWWHFPNTSSFMFRKTAVAEAGGWNEEIKNCTDYDLHFRILLRGLRFRAAPASQALYRHWGTAQATYEKPLRLICTRLELMWQTARKLKSSGALTVEVRSAFEQAAFGAVRLLYPYEPETACREHARLREWNPQFTPITGISVRYRIGYRLGGFKFAEQLAQYTRSFNPFSKPSLGFSSARRIAAD